jgi:two-component system sensor histidine kinase/response regulator
MTTEILPAVRFLLVDDLDDNLLALQALLQREELEFVTARSGTEALERLLEQEISLAIIDVQMPEMDGFELAELMRGTERTRHIPIMFVTAGGRDQQRIFRGYDAGAVDFLFKPLDPHVLRNKAETFFQLSRQRQLLAARLRDRDRLMRRLAETLQLNEMFVAVVGHDLRNPLSSIMGGSEMICELAEDERVERIAQMIATSSRRMARLLDDLSDLARARLGGGLPIQPTATDLLRLAQEAVEESRSSSPGHRIVYEHRGEFRGTWDQDRLGQLFANLLTNAARHGAPGGTITVRLDGSDPSRVAVAVHNPGAIAPEVRSHLFDPFRARAIGGSTSGLGLGLYIVQQIAAAHGGTVSVDSSEAAGTTFTVELPRRVPRP